MLRGLGLGGCVQPAAKGSMTHAEAEPIARPNGHRAVNRCSLDSVMV